MGQVVLLVNGPLSKRAIGSPDASGADGRRLHPEVPSRRRHVEPSVGYKVIQTRTHVGLIAHFYVVRLRPIPNRDIGNPRPSDVPSGMLALERCAPQGTTRREIAPIFHRTSVTQKREGWGRRILESGSGVAQLLRAGQLHSSAYTLCLELGAEEAAATARALIEASNDEAGPGGLQEGSSAST